MKGVFMSQQNEEKEEVYEYQIPDNIMESKRIFGFRRRNWIEGIVCAAIVGLIILQIPFVLRVKIIFLICVCVPILGLNLMGIKDQSLFEAIINLKQSKTNSGEYHLRRCDHEEKFKSKGVEQSVNGSSERTSTAEQVTKFIKDKTERFKATHR